MGEYERLSGSGLHSEGVSSSPGRAEVRVRPGQTPSLVLALIKTFGLRFLVSVVLKYASDLLTFASPLILKYVKSHGRG